MSTIFWLAIFSTYDSNYLVFHPLQKAYFVPPLFYKNIVTQTKDYLNKFSKKFKDCINLILNAQNIYIENLKGRQNSQPIGKIL